MFSTDSFSLVIVVVDRVRDILDVYVDNLISSAKAALIGRDAQSCAFCGGSLKVFPPEIKGGILICPYCGSPLNDRLIKAFNNIVARRKMYYSFRFFPSDVLYSAFRIAVMEMEKEDISRRINELDDEWGSYLKYRVVNIDKEILALREFIRGFLIDFEPIYRVIADSSKLDVLFNDIKDFLSSIFFDQGIRIIWSDHSEELLRSVFNNALSNRDFINDLKKLSKILSPNASWKVRKRIENILMSVLERNAFNSLVSERARIIASGNYEDRANNIINRIVRDKLLVKINFKIALSTLINRLKEQVVTGFRRAMKYGDSTYSEELYVKRAEEKAFFDKIGSMRGIIVLTGPVGSGKTFLAARGAYYLLNNNIPAYFFSLRYIVEEDIDDIFSDAVQVSELFRRRVVLFFDGLDEIDNYFSIAEKIFNKARSFRDKNLLVVITCWSGTWNKVVRNLNLRTYDFEELTLGALKNIKSLKKKYDIRIKIPKSLEDLISIHPFIINVIKEIQNKFPHESLEDAPEIYDSLLRRILEVWREDPYDFVQREDVEKLIKGIIKRDTLSRRIISEGEIRELIDSGLVIVKREVLKVPEYTKKALIQNYVAIKLLEDNQEIDEYISEMSLDEIERNINIIKYARKLNINNYENLLKNKALIETIHSEQIHYAQRIREIIRNPNIEKYVGITLAMMARSGAITRYTREIADLIKRNGGFSDIKVRLAERHRSLFDELTQNPRLQSIRQTYYQLLEEIAQKKLKDPELYGLFNADKRIIVSWIRAKSRQDYEDAVRVLYRGVIDELEQRSINGSACMTMEEIMREYKLDTEIISSILKITGIKPLKKKIVEEIMKKKQVPISKFKDKIDLLKMREKYVGDIVIGSKYIYSREYYVKQLVLVIEFSNGVEIEKVLTIEPSDEIEIGRESTGGWEAMELEVRTKQKVIKTGVYDKAVSRKHLKIKIKGTKVFVMDLGSKGGTYIDNKKITSRTWVEATQKDIRLGPDRGKGRNTIIRMRVKQRGIKEN